MWGKAEKPSRSAPDPLPPLPAPPPTALKILHAERVKLIMELDAVKRERERQLEESFLREATVNRKLHDLIVDIAWLEIHPEMDRIMAHIAANPALKPEP